MVPALLRPTSSSTVVFYICRKAFSYNGYG
jgi:hypothetical protein